MNNHWDNDPAETAELAQLSDALEIAGCVEGDGYVERCEGDEPADFFSVYLHFAGPDAETKGWHGALCIADRPTAAEARQLAAELAARHGLKIYDYARA